MSDGSAIAVSNDSSAAHQDELIRQQQEAIAKDIADNIPLVGDRLDIGQLSLDFQTDPVYKAKVAKLSEIYSHFRRTRPDGNCFFRAVAFRQFELMLSDEKELDKFVEAVKGSKDEMVALGMPEFTVEDFYDNFMDTLSRLKGADRMSEADLSSSYNDEGVSNYLVVFLRLLASKQLQVEGEFYQNFMEGGRTVAEFCSTDVEPMYHESDHIHIIALCSASKLKVRVVYLDRGVGPDPAVHDTPDDDSGPPTVHLLYRPGHYDILYTK